VVRESRQERRDRERIHADALVPAELAGGEVRDLGEEEAAACRDRRDEEREPELVAFDSRAEGAERPFDADEAEQRDDQQRCADNLADDAEHGQRDDDVVGHARTIGGATDRAVSPERCRSPRRTPVSDTVTNLERGCAKTAAGLSGSRATTAAPQTWPSTPGGAAASGGRPGRPTRTRSTQRRSLLR